MYNGNSMHAIINKGNGRYCVSRVFGYYKDISFPNKLEMQDFNRFCIIWNEDKTRLIAYPEYVPGTDYCMPLVCPIDKTDDNWVNLSEDNQCVDFLDPETIQMLLNSKSQPREIIEKCREVDKDYVYNEVKEIKTEQDIDDFEMAVSGFHDAAIEFLEEQKDGSLYIKFSECWGLSAEIWFWGDLEYDVGDKLSDEQLERIWFDSSLFFHEGFIYLVDEEGISGENVSRLEGFCWFKARHMKYMLSPAHYDLTNPEKYAIEIANSSGESLPIMM